jgi:hypothetical protein
MRTVLVDLGLAKQSNPRFSLERAVTTHVEMSTYGAVATGGCHGVFEWRKGRCRQSSLPTRHLIGTRRPSGF